jgi:polyisoprenyl-phosphate glycosyltransferase
MGKVYLSVVIPCYNEEEVLAELVRRVTEVCRATNRSYEFILVNDGSRDQTWPMMVALAATDPHLVLVNLSRNHGHQLALSAGLSQCRGERIFILDADLQDPPELLHEMMKRMDQGADVVYGQRARRRGESVFKRVACTVFYRLLGKLSDIPIALDAGDFRLISRRVLDVLLAMPERHRFIRGMISWAGFRHEAIPYDRPARYAGTTKYPFFKLLRLALDGMTAFSVRPLALASFAGLLTGLFAIGLLIFSLVSWLVYPEAPRGWASLMGAVTILASVQLFVLGIMGEYIGRMYEQVQGRPLFTIERVVRADAAAAESLPHLNGGAVRRTSVESPDLPQGPTSPECLPVEQPVA